MLVIFSPGKLCGSFRDNSLHQEGTLNIIYSLIFGLNFYDFYPGSYINNHPMQPLFYYLKLLLSKDLYSTCLRAFSMLNAGSACLPLRRVPLNREFNVVLISLSPLSFFRCKLGASLRTLWTPKDTGQISQELSYHTSPSLPLARGSPRLPLMTAGQGKYPLGEGRETA